MPDLADLFPGFASRWIDTSAGKIFARTGGSGPPLLLLHGYTQTNVMWHRVAPALAAHFALVIADLPGYGWSAVPAADEDHAPYDKRSMAKAMVERDGEARPRALPPRRPRPRRARRLSARARSSGPRRAARDARHRADLRHVDGMDRNMAMKVWHWPFLAQPAPLPEMLIEKAPVGCSNGRWRVGPRRRTCPPSTRARWSITARAFSDPLRIHAHLRGLSRRASRRSRE